MAKFTKKSAPPAKAAPAKGKPNPFAKKKPTPDANGQMTGSGYMC